MKVPSVGDRVRILATPITIRINLAGRVGFVIGRASTSRAGADLLERGIGDRAIQVRLEREDLAFWLPLDSLEFVDHAEGISEKTIARIGKKNLTRSRNGKWRAFKPN